MKDAHQFCLLAALLIPLACGRVSGGLVEDEFGESWVALDEKETDEEIERLNAIWKKQRELPQTAYIRSRRINSDMRSMTRDDLHALLDKAGLLEDIANLVMLSRAVLPPDRAGDYANQQLWVDGKLGRAEVNGGGLESIAARGEAVTIRYWGQSDQVNLVPNGADRIRFPRLDHFRFIPDEVHPDQIASIRRRDGMLVLEGKPTDGYESASLIDSGHGMLVRFIVKSPAGDIILERRQEGWTKSSEGVLYPRVHIQPRYDSKDITKGIKIEVVEAAQFNHKLPSTLFHVVAVPAGTTLVDERGINKEIRRLTTATDDVLRDANVMK